MLARTDMEAYTCASQTRAWKPDARVSSLAHEARGDEAGILGFNSYRGSGIV